MPRIQASKVLKDAGWPDAAIPDALGVIKAESGGRAGIRNPISCGGSNHAVGWFQVCTIHAGSCGVPSIAARSGRGSATVGMRSVEDWLKNPVNNSKAALCIYKGAGNTFARDWTTWQTGAAQRHRGQDFQVNLDESLLDQAASAIPGVDEVTAAAGAVADVGGVLADIANRIVNPQTWIRLGEGALGGIIVLGGLVALVYLAANKVSSSPAGQIAANVVPAGKVAKGVKGAGKAAWGKV